ncbi:MAG: phosphate signaling complex protein PhoU [Methylococcaceae bacterium]|nr:phosphate signaling complex protein PhoU [Methylococcaceae bacterium]
MTTEADTLTTPHTIQIFESELDHLYCLMIEMTQLVMNQLEQTMQALNDGDMLLAEKVISKDREVKQYEIKIDAEVLMMLARHCPVANDLRTVISSSKIAVELEKIGAEIADFARLVRILFDPSTSDPNPKLLSDIVKIGNLVKIMLGKLMMILNKKEAIEAYTLLQYDRDCENELQEGIKHQLSFVVQDGRLIGRALDIMHIMKSLESCGEHCRNIAEYMIFMIEGIDVRHRSQATTVTLL